MAIIFFVVALFVLSALIIRRVYMQTPRVTSALERELVAYQGRLEKKPNDLRVRVAIAQVYARMGDKTRAVAELEKVLEVKSDYWDALFQLGMIHLNSNKKAEAISQFKKAAKAKPDDELAYYQLGTIAYKDGRYKNAAVYMEKTVEISPILADGHYYLASSYEHLGEKEQAKRQYEEALKYIPDYEQAKDGLARVQP